MDGISCMQMEENAISLRVLAYFAVNNKRAAHLG